MAGKACQCVSGGGVCLSPDPNNQATLDANGCLLVTQPAPPAPLFDTISDVVPTNLAGDPQATPRNVAGLTWTVPEDGLYDVSFTVTGAVGGNPGVTSLSVRAGLAVNGAEVPGSLTLVAHMDDPALSDVSTATKPLTLPLSAGDVVTVQGSWTAAGGLASITQTQVGGYGGNGAATLSWRKVG